MTQTKRDTQPTPQPASNDVAEAVAEHVKCIAKQQSSGRYKLTSAARDAISAGRTYQDDDCFAEARDILRHRQQAAVDAAWKMFNERAAMHGTAAAGGILTAFGSVSLMFPPLAPVGAVAVAVGLAASTSGGIAALIHEPRAVEAAEEMLAKLQAKHENFAIKAIYHIQKALKESTPVSHAHLVRLMADVCDQVMRNPKAWKNDEQAIAWKQDGLESLVQIYRSGSLAELDALMTLAVKQGGKLDASRYQSWLSETCK